MSTHRKIEWALFILGVVGLCGSLFWGAEIIQTALLGVGALFAGLHVFHLFDGHKSNHVVVATSVALVAYTAYRAFNAIESIANEQATIAGLMISILLTILSLRLRRDFHPR